MTPPPPPRSTRCYTNFRLADWAAFVEETEAVIPELPEPVLCATGEKFFRNVLLAASSHCIPSGFRKEYTPGLPCEAILLTERLDRLRLADPHDPEIVALNDQISSIVCESSWKTWHEKVEKCDLKSDPTRCWALIRNLSGKRA
jgi:hypothetical protein